MKKLIAIWLFIATAFTATAQDMTFEATVKYIQEKITCCSQHPLEKQYKFSATKDGTISWASDNFQTKTINLLDLYEKDEPGNGSSNTIEFSKGIRRWNDRISFNKNGRDYDYFINFENENDLIRIYKALLHLRSFCTKKKDPFDL